LFVGVDFKDPSIQNNPGFDPQVLEDYKEDEVIRKVEDFKNMFLKMKEKVEEA
jgi:hypothetical protein